MNKKKIIAFLVVIALIVLWQYLGLSHYITLEAAKSAQGELNNYINEHFLLASLSYFLLYIGVTAFSIPGAAIFTLLGAALFGLIWSLVLVSFASSIGATLAFLFSRFILRDSVEAKFSTQLKKINQGVEKEGTLYLLTLRLIPAFPFFMINLLMGLTKISVARFYLVSQIGMLPGTLVFLNAGTQLSQIESTSDILSLPILLSLVLLGLFPLVIKGVMSWLAKRKIYRGWAKPKSFDRNLIVIGAGSGGLVSAYIAAAVKAKVTLIEKHKMGGDCLNTGCVPSKALIKIAHVIAQSQHSERFGVTNGKTEVEFEKVMARVHQVIAKVAPHDSVDRYESLGVECLQGEATILSPWKVEVNGEVLTTKQMIIATGARPFLPDINNLEKVNFYTSDTIWHIKEQPKKLLVLGGGPIGTELAQCFARLGTKVTQVERSDQLLGREEADAALLVAEQLERDGVEVLLNHQIESFEVSNQQQFALIKHDNETIKIEFDAVLVALGRKANVTGFGLEALGIETRVNGTIATNEYLQTKYPNIFAVGDVTGPYQLTHAAAHQAWYASVNALFGSLKRFRADYSVLPAVTYSSPELARVGLNQKEADAQGIPYEVTQYDINDLDRAIAEGEDHGFIRVLTVPGKDKILGVTIVGFHAGELLTEFTLAMRHGLGLEKILATIHPYPTLSEANKYAAGVWKKNHAPEALLRWVSRYHDWRRG